MKIEEIKLPGKLTRKESDLRSAFLEQVAFIPGGEKIKTCLQCGTCTGSCAVAYAMDFSTRELIALFRAGDIESILNSKTIWICASCYACQTRCPAGIKITDIIYALKRTAMERKIYSKKFPIHALANSFMKNIHRYGRLNEPRLMMSYLLKTGILKAFNYLPLGIAMASKGHIKYKPSKINDVTGLRKMMKMAEKMDMPVEREEPVYEETAVGYRAIG